MLRWRPPPLSLPLSRSLSSLINKQSPLAPLYLSLSHAHKQAEAISCCHINNVAIEDKNLGVPYVPIRIPTPDPRVLYHLPLAMVALSRSLPLRFAFALLSALRTPLSSSLRCAVAVSLCGAPTHNSTHALCIF